MNKAKRVRRVSLGLLAVVVIAAAVWAVPRGAHLLTCLDSERAGCPHWCWTCGPAPCEANGGVRSISDPFLGPRVNICRDGTLD